MTGTFTTRRRKQDASRRAGLLGNGSGLMPALAALGIGIGRSSPHQGSKPGYEHLTLPGPLTRFARAQEWQVSTGRPLPPQMRARRPLPPPQAMGPRHRWYGYLGRALEPPDGSTLPSVAGTLYQRSTQDILDDPALSSAQRRRLLHKAGRRGERPAGYRSAASIAEAQRIARVRARRAGWVRLGRDEGGGVLFAAPAGTRGGPDVPAA